MKRGMHAGLGLVALTAVLGLAGSVACGNAEAAGATPSEESSPAGGGGGQGAAPGQAGAQGAGQPGEQGGAQAGGTQAMPGMCSPQELMGIHRAFFEAEAARAKMALGSAQEAVVRDYAQKTLDRYNELAAKMNQGGASAGAAEQGGGDISNVLNAMQQENLAALQASRQFDRDYVASEIIDYSTMLGMVDMLRSGMCGPVEGSAKGGQPGGQPGAQPGAQPAKPKAPSGNAPATQNAPSPNAPPANAPPANATPASAPPTNAPPTNAPPAGAQGPQSGAGPQATMAEMLDRARQYIKDQLQLALTLEQQLLEGMGPTGSQPPSTNTPRR